MTEFSQSF